MLILTRRTDETIEVNGPCTIFVLGIDNRYGRVQLGIAAAPGVGILRGELAEASGATTTPRRAAGDFKGRRKPE